MMERQRDEREERDRELSAPAITGGAPARREGLPALAKERKKERKREITWVCVHVDVERVFRHDTTEQVDHDILR